MTFEQVINGKQVDFEVFFDGDDWYGSWQTLENGILSDSEDIMLSATAKTSACYEIVEMYKEVN